MSEQVSDGIMAVSDSKINKAACIIFRNPKPLLSWACVQAGSTRCAQARPPHDTAAKTQEKRFCQVHALTWLTLRQDGGECALFGCRGSWPVMATAVPGRSSLAICSSCHWPLFPFLQERTATYRMSGSSSDEPACTPSSEMWN